MTPAEDFLQESFLFVVSIFIVLAIAALVATALVRLLMTGPPPPAPPWGTRSDVPDPSTDRPDRHERS